MPTEDDRTRSGIDTAQVNTGTTQKKHTVNPGDGRVGGVGGVPTVASMALGSALSAPFGLPVSANNCTSCKVMYGREALIKTTMFRDPHPAALLSKADADNPASTSSKCIGYLAT